MEISSALLVMAFVAVALGQQVVEVTDGVTVEMTAEQEECNSHHFTSCEECTSSSPGCHWCPGNALCGYHIPPLLNLSTTACPTIDDFVTGAVNCVTNSNNAFSDPLYNAMEWSFNILNVQPVWDQGLTGEGIHIQVVDSGVEANHSEFASKFDANASCPMHTPLGRYHPFEHGTGVASIATASGNNDECAVGIAPDATLSACYFPLLKESLAPFEGFYYEPYTRALESGVDISINSWNDNACEDINSNRRRLQATETLCPLYSIETGEQPSLLSKNCSLLLSAFCGAAFETQVQICTKYLSLYTRCTYNKLPEEELATIETAIQEGRDGKGIIFVFAAGNEYKRGEVVNMEGYLNSRYTITVGAVGKDSLHASYSSTGDAALFISAPGGDYEFSTNNIVANLGGGCHDISVGTSFAAPAVGGALALVLQANPDLTWRDVQGILADTAVKHDPDSLSWTTNAAGYHHSAYYGFGGMDTYAAVEAAKNWTNFGPEMIVSNQTSIIDLPIGESAAHAAVSSIIIEADERFITESVVLHLDLEHPSRGELQIVLESPQGTVANILPSNRRETSQGTNVWELMSVKTWGENPKGAWKLVIVDWIVGSPACVDESFVVKIHGNESLDCHDMRKQVCVDGMVNDIAAVTAFNLSAIDLVDSSTGFAFTEACCDCGGGIDTAGIQSLLSSWNLRVFGRIEGEALFEAVEQDEVAVQAEEDSIISGSPAVTTNPLPPPL